MEQLINVKRLMIIAANVMMFVNAAYFEVDYATVGLKADPLEYPDNAQFTSSYGGTEAGC